MKNYLIKGQDKLDIKYFIRDHKGGLKESLETQVYITTSKFQEILATGNYKYYAYDPRVQQDLWKNINNDQPMWLGVEK